MLQVKLDKEVREERREQTTRKKEGQTSGRFYEAKEQG